MKLLFSVGTILLLSALVSGQDDTRPEERSEVAEKPEAEIEIEDKVAEVMDVLEVLEDDGSSISENYEDDSAEERTENLDEVASSVGDVENPEVEYEDASKSDKPNGEVELIDEARDNKFTFLSLFHGKYYESYYQKINNYLVDKLEENDNTKDNMVVALEWLHTLEQSNNIFKDKSLIQALKQFTALTKISGDNLCSKTSYGILRKNDLATKGNGHKRMTKLGAMRRIDKIVYEYSIQHAIDCLREYPLKFAHKRAQLNQEQLSYVESLIDLIFQVILRPKSVMSLISNLYTPKKNMDPTELVRDITTLNKPNVGEVTLEKLRYYARNDPDRKYFDFVNDDRSGKYLIRDDKVRGLFDKYIVKPCEYYIEQLGFDVLIPMRYDIQMLEPEDRYLLNNDQVIDFYIGYARFRACNLLVYQDQKDLARHVVKAVHKQSNPVV